MIHLKRIVFDFDTFLNIKINSKIEFPEFLNIESYTKEGIQIRDFEKKLLEEKENENKNDNNNEFVVEEYDFEEQNPKIQSPIISRTTSERDKEQHIAKTMSDVKKEIENSYKRK